MQFRTVLVKTVLSFGPICSGSGTIASILVGGPIARPGPPLLSFGLIIIGSETTASALACGPIAWPGPPFSGELCIICSPKWSSLCQSLSKRIVFPSFSQASQAHAFSCHTMSSLVCSVQAYMACWPQFTEYSYYIHM